MNLQFLVPVLNLIDRIKAKRKSDLEKIADKDKNKYAGFNIQYHDRYEEGTFMLFGFDRKKKRELLLAETNTINVAQQWSDAYDCQMPDLTSFTPCSCCK